MNVCIIPARGGSKRIPRKNIREFCGKPMIAWTIEAANASGCIDKVLVSTDDEEIAAISREAGAETPFMRPKELADDRTETRPVLAHAIRESEKAFGVPNFVCCLYATAPFIEADDLKNALTRLREEGRVFVFSAAAYRYPIQRALRKNASGGVEMLCPEFRQTRSQDLEETFHDAGQFYWGTAEAFLDDTPIFSENASPYLLPGHRVHDIDTIDDWERAELFFRALRASD